ncbi:MAG: ATP synthase F0 subunit B [Thermodesulfovibrionia bacterium]|nr:ATP synthase F0 subunit B [Thermodesulfovibrionia bacterium]
MLDINQYFFWQLANFSILFIALYYILFKPFLRLFKEREDSTKGALDSARAMDGEKDDIIARIDEKLLDARGQAKTVFEKFSNEGLDNQKQTLDSAQNEAVEINRKAKADLEAATEKATTSLKSDIEKFSRQIVDKLVGA